VSEGVIDLGTRRGLFVDRYLIDELDGAALQLPWVLEDADLHSLRSCAAT
jgi:hypothetical protein